MFCIFLDPWSTLAIFSPQWMLFIHLLSHRLPQFVSLMFSICLFLKPNLWTNSFSSYFYYEIDFKTENSILEFKINCETSTYLVMTHLYCEKKNYTTKHVAHYMFYMFLLNISPECYKIDQFYLNLSLNFLNDKCFEGFHCMNFMEKIKMIKNLEQCHYKISNEIQWWGNSESEKISLISLLNKYDRSLEMLKPAKTNKRQIFLKDISELYIRWSWKKSKSVFFTFL